MPDQNNYPSDQPRIQRDILRKGAIDAIEGDKVRVRIGELLTNWLRWSNPRAGKLKITTKPSIGEQVMVFAENGNLNTGVILGSINSDTNPMPLDCGPDDLVVDIPAGGKLVFRCGSSFIVMTENAITLNATRIDLN